MREFRRSGMGVFERKEENFDDDNGIFDDGDTDESPEQEDWWSDATPPSWLSSAWISYLADRTQVWEASLWLRATLGLFGTVFLWVGHWNVLTTGRVGHKDCMRWSQYHLDHNETEHDHYYAQWKKIHSRCSHDEEGLLFSRFGRVWFYIGLGFLLSVWSDTLVWQTGLPGSLFPPQLWGRASPKRRVWLYFLRWIVGLFGMMLLWSGLNDLFDYFVGTPSTVRECLFLCGGVVGLLLIHEGTLDVTTYVYSKTYEKWENDPVSWRSSSQVRVKWFIISTLSIVFQAMIWLATWNLAGLNEFDIAHSTASYPCSLVLYGFTTMLLCKSYVASAWMVDTPDPSETPYSNRDVLHALRSILALSGYFNYFNGLWVIFDVYFLKNDLNNSIDDVQNYIAIAIGVIFMCAAGTCVSNVMQPVQGDEESLSYVRLEQQYEDEI